MLVACGAPDTWRPPPDDALWGASRAVRRASNTAEREAALPNDELTTRLLLVSSLLGEREFAAAAVHLEVITRAEPRWFSYRYELARCLVYGNGDLDRALSELDACIELSREIAACHELRGLVLRDLGRADEAIDALETAQRLDASRPTGREALARLYVAVGRDADATTLVDLELRRRGDEVSLLLLRAGIAERAGEANAELYLARVAAAHQEPVAGMNYLLRYYERMGRTEESERLRRRIEDELRRRQPQRNMRDL